MAPGSLEGVRCACTVQREFGVDAHRKSPSLLAESGKCAVCIKKWIDRSLHEITLRVYMGIVI